ncbi:hypothetical protein FJZ36_07920 [Candidatus Poribacteria bacterium]|nr:hypothetical protein [Candidatus Poribacteria bacterium]
MPGHVVNLAETEEPFLARAVRAGIESGGLSNVQIEEITRGIGALASVRADALVLISPVGTIGSVALQSATARVSIGLEACAGSLDQGVALLAGEGVTRLYAEGDRRLNVVVARAVQVRESLHFRNPLSPPLRAIDELDLLNGIEDLVARDIVQCRVSVAAPVPRFTDVAQSMPIDHLDRLTVAHAQLDAFAARVDLFSAFPPHELFIRDYPTDELGDTARMVLCRLWVRLVTGAGSPLRFDVTPEQVEMVLQDLRPEVLASLRRWNHDFIRSHVSGPHAAGAVEYMDAVLATLPDSLEMLC